jgi:hypothetical protein
VTDLIAFLTARLDEDEQWALAASAPYRYAVEGATVPAGGVHWTWVVGENWTPVTADPAVDDTVGGPEHYGCPVNLASVEQWPTASRPDRPMRRTVATEMVEVDSSAAGHIARHDPARVLREVEANRWILEQHVHYRFPPHPEGWLPQDFEATQPAFPGSDMPYVGCAVCDWNSDYEHVDANTWCGYVRRLATAWSDHPDFREEWALPTS